MIKEDLVFIPHLVINPSNLVAYSEVIGCKRNKSKSVNFIDTEKPIEDQKSFINSSRKSEGYVSNQAKRKISKALEYLITTSVEKKVEERLTGKTITFKTAFLTLTLPSAQIHSDKEIINTCLNSFLNECRKYHNVRNYVWRAELQSNGNIHFHIITDSFIPWYEARNRWNRIVNKLGYVDRFHSRHGHRTPNSTDIHSTRKIKNLKAYLIKYMAKDVNKPKEVKTGTTEKRSQAGRIWACNQELSKTRGLNLIIDSEIDSELKKIVECPECRKYVSDYFTVYYIDYHLFLKYGSEILFQYFSAYLFKQLGFSEQLKFNQASTFG